MVDFIFRGSLADLDPEVYKLTQLESERQARKLIMIPSESLAPLAVREAMASSFQNIYAEGYPDEEYRWMTEDEIFDYADRLGYYRRYGDPRYYKGVEYADIAESLARRRCAQLFAPQGWSPDNLFVNVQPLSGAPANSAVYTALLNPGDTILGMDLLHGGHLTHGSPVSRSGKIYKAVHYQVNSETEQLDYDSIQALANEFKPKILIAGYSSYPWVPDWTRFRAIADSVGATLLADVSHIAGLIAAGVVPSPVGIAHVTTFTTHKTLCGPRGACIITTDPVLTRKIDRGVFPGEQGGPHVHIFPALALTFKLAATPQFKQLQKQIVANCIAFTARLQERGIRIPFGGTNTHLTNIDCKPIIGVDGTGLSGDMAARILDIAGIVANRNTIPGDKNALSASGVRFGTPWVTQRGLLEPQMQEIADIIADLLHATEPYAMETRKGDAIRAKVDFGTLEEARLKVRALTEKACRDDSPQAAYGYPHFYYIDDQPQHPEDWISFDLTGEHARYYMNYVFSADIEHLSPGDSRMSELHIQKHQLSVQVSCLSQNHYRVTLPRGQAGLAAAWLRDLSDGYVLFDQDLIRRIPGPITVVETGGTGAPPRAAAQTSTDKPYFIGISAGGSGSLPEFSWQAAETPVRKTPLNQVHREMGAKMVPFAGWDMPVWYTSVVEEHLATRQAAGLFDVSHMGVLQVEGADASLFLDSVCANEIASLGVGESCYTHFFDPDANVIDDTLVYRRSAERYLVVVNASNDDKDWAWLNAVRQGKVLVDRLHPWVKAFGRQVILRNLRDPKEGVDRLVDVALQGPKAREILLALGCDAPTRKRIIALKRTGLCEALIGGFTLVVSRTGYTGEKMAFELFIHPDQAANLWNAILAAGQPLGLKPCGLGARDSLRTEAGLPLYGHEMAGPLSLGVAEAGFGSYVKTYKPWFIGRDAYIEKEKQRQSEVARFCFTEKGVRMAHLGDPVVDRKGRVIGKVTSCAVNAEGFLTGQAWLELPFTVENTPIAIYQSAPKSAGKPPAELMAGDKVILPTSALIISRFPK